MGLDSIGGTKAVMHFYIKNQSAETNIQGQINKTFNIEEVMYNVMINPNTIHMSYGIKTVREETIGFQQGKVHLQKDSEASTMSMDLIFDLVDIYDMAYNKLSTTGLMNMLAIPIQSIMGKRSYKNQKYATIPKKTSMWANMGVWASDVTLTNPDFSCLPLLIKAASSNDAVIGTYVEFNWGSFNVKGTVSDLNIRYTYFSPEGKPLRAEASLCIDAKTAADFAKFKKTVGLSIPNIPQDNTAEPDTDAAADFDDAYGFY